MFPSVEVLPVVSGHALGSFCHCHGRFLGIILLPTAYHTLLKAQECSSCSTGIIVSAGFPFPARAGGGRRSHIPSSPHQRPGPQGRQQRLPAPSPPQNQLFQGLQGTQPRAQHRSGLGSAGWEAQHPRRCGQGLGWAAGQMCCSAVFLHPPASPISVTCFSFQGGSQAIFCPFVLMQGQCSPRVHCVSQTALLE